MTHSLLIVGGTRKKRSIEACRVAAGGGDVVAADLWSAPSPAENVVAPSYGAHFDTTILEPEEDKQTISIDQIRDLQHQLSLKPYAAECKTGIIFEAQRLTIEAQNALLKTLEEPPAHSVLILTAPSAKQLLPTVVSRCQIVPLPAEIDLDLESEEYKKAAAEFLTLLQSGRGERLGWVEENKSAINNQLLTINLLDVWISVLRDLLLIQQRCKNLKLNNLTIQQFNQSDKSISLCSSILLTQKTKNLIAKTNVSPRLALEVLLLDLPVFQP